MGRNDRFFEDPYIPYESKDDSDAYDNWTMHMEFLRAEEEAGGLTSNNIQPGDLPEIMKETQDNVAILARLRELTAQSAKNNENQNSRQPAHNQIESEDRAPYTAPDR
jgi:hypothetical protein